MGVTLDCQMSMESHLKQITARLCEAFEKHHGSSRSAGIPWLAIAASVPTYVVPSGMYGSGLCVGINHAEVTLNRIQARWARELLGLQNLRVGSWCHLVTQCGWQCRLGSLLLAEAIMLEARVLIFPENAPARRLLVAAQASPWLTWGQHVRLARQKLGGMPSIIEWAGARAVSEARLTSWSRKRLTGAYKHRILKPQLKKYDQDAFQAGSGRHGWPFATFQSPFAPLNEDILWADWQPRPWSDLQVWAAARATGRFPLILFGGDGAPASLSVCRLCGVPSADVKHALFECPAVSRASLGPTRETWPELQQVIFGGGGRLSQVTVFVAETLRAAAGF